MIDYHLHIGQFNNSYYDSYEIFELIEKTSEKTNITEVRYASTSSCRDDAELKELEEEIGYAQQFNSKILKTYPYLWYIPKFAEQKINVKSAAEAFDYCGIKLHPLAQQWDDSNELHKNALHQIFQWANDNQKTILIHCGTQICDLPTRFENYFSEYNKAKIILAHSNPMNETAKMVNKYDNVFCDISCMNENQIKLLKNQVIVKSKILFGSDFPITYYFSTQLFNKHISLENQYFKDCKHYLQII